MTNKYEHAADLQRALVSVHYGNVEWVELAITLLRAAARLPDGVDPVQVLEEAASYFGSPHERSEDTPYDSEDM